MLEKIINFLKGIYEQPTDGKRELLDYKSQLSNIPDDVERDRIYSYNQYFEYFDGDIIKYIDSSEGKRPYSNIVSNFVYKLNGWLLQEEPIIKSKNILSDLIQELVNELLENTDKSFIQTILLNTSIYGDCFVKVFVDLKEMEIFKDSEQLFTFGFKVIEDPRYCFVAYNSQGELSNLIVVYPNLSIEGLSISEEQGLKYSYPLYFEVWDKKFVYCSYNFLLDEYKYFDYIKKYKKNQYLIDGLFIDVQDSPYYGLYKFENIYRDIPFVHFRNLPFFGTTYGVSDVRSLTVLAREKTSLINVVKDIINFHGIPPLVVKGASMNNIYVSEAGKVFSNVPKDAEFSYITAQIGDLDKIINIYEKMIENEISGTGLPYEFLVSSKDFISGDSSASAMKLKFSSVLIYLILKKSYLESSFQELFKKGLTYLNNFNDLGLEKVRFPDAYSAKKIININEFLQDAIFNVYLENVRDDQIVKEVIDDLEAFGLDVKPSEIMDILSEMSEEYQQMMEDAIKYINEISVDKDKIQRFVRLRAIPYNQIEFSFKNYLPFTRTQILSDLEVELRNNLESLSGALSRLGIKNVDKKIDEIMRESELIGTIKGLIDKSQQKELLDVEKLRQNLDLLNQIEQQNMQQEQADETFEKEQDSFQEDDVSLPSEGLQETPMTERVLDSKGGKGRKKVQENPQKIENETGQVSESVIEKRKLKSQN